jgi:group I intron endonuclease
MKRIVNKIYLIYKFTNKLNGKSYIGLTCRGLELRKYDHLYSVSKNSQYQFHQAIRKYGIENFNEEILEKDIMSLKEANAREIFYVNYYSTYVNGYNMTVGGGYRSEYVLSDASREKMRQAKLGVKQSDATKLKHSVALKGIPKSAEHNINAAKGRIGVKLSNENCDKMSKRMLKRFSGSKNPAAIRINIYDNLGNIVVECNGNFEPTCKNLGLPLIALRKSSYNNGKPIYAYKNMKREVLNRFGEYVGWYALKL